MKKLIFWLCISLSQWVQAQDRTLPLTISIFNEATAIPFTRFITTPIHPGLQAGTSFTYHQKNKSRLFQTANLSYFYHRYLSQGIGLNTELGYAYRTHSGLSFEGLFGLGYLHTFATGPEYLFEDGQYTKRNDRGNARLTPSISLGLGYCLHPDEINSTELFLRYQAWVEYPYSPDFIPVMTHINLHLGVKTYLHFNRPEHE